MYTRVAKEANDGTNSVPAVNLCHLGLPKAYSSRNQYS